MDKIRKNAITKAIADYLCFWEILEISKESGLSDSAYYTKRRLSQLARVLIYLQK